MIELLIFHLHIAGALFAFTKFWQKKGLKDGILSILIIGLFFCIGWALTGTLARLVMPSAWNRPLFNQDTLSLVLLIIPEIYFFKHFIINEK